MPYENNSSRNDLEITAIMAVLAFIKGSESRAF